MTIDVTFEELIELEKALIAAAVSKDSREINWEIIDGLMKKLDS